MQLYSFPKTKIPFTKILTFPQLGQKILAEFLLQFPHLINCPSI